MDSLRTQPWSKSNNYTVWGTRKGGGGENKEFGKDWRDQMVNQENHYPRTTRLPKGVETEKPESRKTIMSGGKRMSWLGELNDNPVRKIVLKETMAQKGES